MLRPFRVAGITGLLLAFVAPCAVSDETVAGKIVAGVIEPIAIGPSGFVIDAKLDTGADTCSLSARDLQPFERDGAQWVRFRVAGRDGQSETIEAPVVRTVRIKRENGSSPPRPVVRLPICLAGVQREVEVSLADRRRFAYPALVGRNFLAGHVVVDAARERITTPDCAPQSRR